MLSEAIDALDKLSEETIRGQVFPRPGENLGKTWGGENVIIDIFFLQTLCYQQKR